MEQRATTRTHAALDQGAIASWHIAPHCRTDVSGAEMHLHQNQREPGAADTRSIQGRDPGAQRIQLVECRVRGREP